MVLMYLYLYLSVTPRTADLWPEHSHICAVYVFRGCAPLIFLENLRNRYNFTDVGACGHRSKNEAERNKIYRRPAELD